jgi:hypothetical protein
MQTCCLVHITAEHRNWNHSPIVCCCQLHVYSCDDRFQRGCCLEERLSLAKKYVSAFCSGHDGELSASLSSMLEIPASSLSSALSPDQSALHATLLTAWQAVPGPGGRTRNVIHLLQRRQWMLGSCTQGEN